MFFDGLLNSTIVTVGATALAITPAPARATSIRAIRSRFLDASVLFLIIVRLIPPIVVTLPLFPIVNAIGLNDTHLVLIVLYATFFVSLGTVLMRTFIDQIPRELDEAAQIDGATRIDHPAARSSCRWRRPAFSPSRSSSSSSPGTSSCLPSSSRQPKPRRRRS